MTIEHPTAETIAKTPKRHDLVRYRTGGRIGSVVESRGGMLRVLFRPCRSYWPHEKGELGWRKSWINAYSLEVIEPVET